MIKFTHGDILRADVEAIVNTVNCVGVMGRGIALQFKKAWPENFKAYALACKNEEVKPGQMFIFETGQLANPRFIINFPTKRHWRAASRMEDIESGLRALVVDIKKYNIKSIAIPPLGAGLGGLDWLQVRQKIEQVMGELPAEVQVYIYEPQGATERKTMARQQKTPQMTAGRAVLIELIQRYLDGLLDPTVSLLEVHKLLYFMQAAGEPLRLKYQKAHYGPYAENLRHVLNAIEGHFISGYADGGDTPAKEIQLVPGAVQEARYFLQKYPNTRDRFERVSRLVDGFESPFGLELLATVHWLSQGERIESTDAIVEATHTWSVRKAQFTPRQINVAVRTLEREQWLAV